ncbi:MAG: prolyl oligopeptidase family serine peptidase [Bacteroidales bacterium]|nr:prolyl oligopeptidase family serine peptidase [Bacteroidales bacterium]
MKRFIYLILLIAFIGSACTEKKGINYPVTNKVDHVDDYFGTKVADPYRWLEDDNSEETAEWVKAENAITDAYLAEIPFRENINKRLTEIWDYPKYGVPFKNGKHYFFFKNDGMQNQSVLYIQADLESEPEVFLDPNKLSEDGTVALSSVAISKDGKYLAYSIAKAGSDWNEIYVMEVENKKKLNDEIKWVKFSNIAWKDEGFYYSRYDEPKQGDKLSGKNEFHKIYYHKLSSAQKNDKLIFENKDYPLRNYVAITTEDEKYLFIIESESTSGNSLYFTDLSTKGHKFKQLAKGFDYEYNLIDNIGKKFLILTNHNASKNQLVLIDPVKPTETEWKVIIPEKEEVLQSVSLTGNRIVAEYIKDAASKAYIYDMTGKYIDELELPCLGTLAGFNSKKNENIAFYSFTSFTFPNTVYKYDINTNKSEIYTKPEIDFNTDNYITRQVFYESKDGTKVPMFIVHKKDIEMNGNNPTYLYGYGGFNINLTPYFSISRLIFLENGGVFALPNIRGGGEYGEDWHKAGTKLQKQNVFDDFIAAAEYLINEKYTSTEKLAISGASNGGLLVGACMTQRPELFRVALPAVGVMDMLRFHKFTIGWAWTTDYGSSEDSTEFNYLLGYSPLHNLKQGVDYPATLITTADHDDRVVPAHSFKFAATLQEKNKGNNPVLIRIETKAGHGRGKPTSKLIEEYTDIWAFTFYNLGMKPVSLSK